MNDEKNRGNGEEETRAEMLRLLEEEFRDKAARIRNVQLPQKVGMAAAARLAADKLPTHLVALVQAQVSDGRLAKQWEEVCKRATDGEKTNETVALATLLVGQVTLVREWLVRVAGNNEADAHRFEGQAIALENEANDLAARAARTQVTGEAPPRREEGERPENPLEARRGKTRKSSAIKRSKADAADA
jgi:hypothetical protein